MQQRHRKFIVRKSLWIAIFLLVVSQLGDIITTIINMVKHSSVWREHEIQPLFIRGVPLWLLLAVKLILVIYLAWVIYKYYSGWNIYWRYIFTYGIVFFILLSSAVTINNIKFMQKDTENLKPILPEQRVEVYKEQIDNLKVVSQLKPKQIPKMPLAFWMFFWNFIIFCLWVDFEKGFKNEH